VRTPDQVDQAADAGAVFVMTGGFNPKVVERCREKGLTIIPGCSGPGDIERALDGGIKVVKLFPIEQLGGLAYLQALSPLYPELRFVPSGGLNRSNLASYMAWDKTFAAGGSWMARPELIRAGRFDRVSALCKESVSLMLGFSLAHVGVNADSSEEALKVAKCFETMFGFATRELPVSVFAADLVEVMKPPYRGKHGHIGIGTYNVARARAYLERKGFAFDETSLKKDDQGNPRLIYLKEETGGFGIHLVRKNFS
jgi:2-dehydro-3-deoxyphosphogluconate aldolase/(4S)-4-hydroxy-2-oxoglutarate aldolase